MKYLLILVLLLSIIASSIFLLRQDDKKEIIEPATELQHLYSFPNELSDEQSDVILSNPTNLTFSEDLIFISDQAMSTILTFDHYGNFMNELGREGRGPMEFMNQSGLHYINEKLFVNDQGNRRFTVIDTVDSLTTSYPLHLPRFITSGNLIFGYKQHPPAKRDNIAEDPLITVFDSELNEINSFGEFINVVDNIIHLASAPFLKTYNNMLYVQFQNYPDMRAYTFDGALIDSLSFDLGEYYKKRVESNYQRETFAHEYIFQTKKLFSAFDVNDQGLFFNLHDEHLIIDHFDHQGDFIQRFREDIHGEDFSLRDMNVLVKEDGNLLFYVLNMTNGIPKVDVYEGIITTKNL
ncbi:MAG: 6-bladed beta-propeller [Balneolales bacterium]